MATLLLTAVAGNLSLAAGSFGLFAANLAATALGTFIDNRLFGPKDTHTTQEGPRLNEISLSSSSEGQPVKQLFGRSRIGGNLMWATNFKETKIEVSETQGGKGGGPTATLTTTTYEYTISFAVGLCEGHELLSMNRIWFDGRLIDHHKYTIRFYRGTDTQSIDPKIEAVEGVANAPSYRGLAYVVFEDLPLKDFGNRIPQVNVELTRPIVEDASQSMELLLKAVNVIPATGDFIYSEQITTEDDGNGNAIGKNVFQNAGVADFVDSMQRLQDDLPNVSQGNLGVSWFGDDLRVGTIEIQPRVENAASTFLPVDWECEGLDRTTVTEVSTDIDSNSNFGSTPSDLSVVQGMLEMEKVGVKSLFYPFLLMDIPSGNALPDPYGGAEQSAFPWRGRITLASAADDGTAAAATQVSDFFGSVAATDFSIASLPDMLSPPVNREHLTFSGLATDWGYRRFILHYAHICVMAANAMDDPTFMSGFYIGSEMVGLTRIREAGTGVYPAVAALKTLAADVKAIFAAAGYGHIDVSYAADWSEYHSHRPDDASGDVFFNMDDLWSDANIDFVAIDNYFPISDLVTAYDIGSGDSVYNEAYLQSNIEGGEGFDYYYASPADRIARTQTPITDGGYSKPWVFRQKDIRSWLTETHYDRPAGVESGSASPWTASSKRMVFSEFGCPAVNLGANQPNVFYDPKSSESAFPYFSTGVRDDQMIRSYYQAVIKYWDAAAFALVSTNDMFAWAWDARPFPAFPARADVWSDTENYQLGHWLNGRSGAGPLSELIKIVCKKGGLEVTDLDVSALDSSGTIVNGYVIDSSMSPRAALTPLFSAFFMDAFEDNGKLTFVLRARAPEVALDVEDFVSVTDSPSGYSLTRAQETDLPKRVTVAYIDELSDYEVKSIPAFQPRGTSEGKVELRFPLNFDGNYAKYVAEVALQEAWISRDSFEAAVAPSMFKINPGDNVSFTDNDRNFVFHVMDLDIGNEISITGYSFDNSIYDKVVDIAALRKTGTPTVFGLSKIVFLDIPLFSGEEPSPWAPRVGAYQNPFPEAVNVYRDSGTDLFLRGQQFVPVQMGELREALPSGPTDIIDEGNTLKVTWYDPSFQLLADTEENVRSGSNVMALKTSTGDWEILRYINSTLISGNEYDLSRLIRGDFGTAPIMEASTPIGSQVVLLQADTIDVLSITEDIKLSSIDYRYGPSNYTTGSAYYQDITHSGQAVGQLPYAVTHIEFTDVGADVQIDWVRQTRFGGTGFEEATVPLNEETEEYEIDIFDAGMVLLSTVMVDGSSMYTYVGAPAIFSIAIYQISATIGRGRSAEANYGV